MDKLSRDRQPQSYTSCSREIKILVKIIYLVLLGQQVQISKLSEYKKINTLANFTYKIYISSQIKHLQVKSNRLFEKCAHKHVFFYPFLENKSD